MLEAIFRQGGHKTGMFTSPHLQQVEERIRINGQPISEMRLANYLVDMRPVIDRLGCTYFEALTAIAFKHFSDSQVDIAFVEVGLGGTFDATNVVQPVLSIITTIDFDHCEYLGDTLTKIAQEKAGIVKQQVPCVVQTQTLEVDKLLEDICRKKNAPMYSLPAMCTLQIKGLSEAGSTFDIICDDEKLSGLRLSLAGETQIQNAALAVLVWRILNRLGLRAGKEAVLRGLQAVDWCGRLQKLQDHPKIVVDVAHNTGAIRSLLRNLRQVFTFEKLIIVIGLLADKNYPAITQLISAAADHIFVVTPQSDRALQGAVLMRELRDRVKSHEILADFDGGFAGVRGRASKDDLICVTGSHYVVGEFLSFYKKS